jgi:peptidoglycan/xylan/chitin deacetylase (PgdA/CDA1 family)
MLIHNLVRSLRPLPWLLAAALVAAIPRFADAQSVALTFDDGLDPREEPQAAAWNEAILDALAADGVKSMLFAAGARVDSAQGMALVRDWGLAGHSIGNHTYTHSNFDSHRMTLERFIADIERDEALLQNYPGWTPRLRFPYLKEGNTALKRDGMRAWQSARRYESGAVSIDTSDWYYDERYRKWRALHPQADSGAYRDAYLQHIWARSLYYDSLSRKLLRRSAKYVILLHTRRINADFLPDMIHMFRSKGWTIISPAEAFSDPLYSMTPAVLPAGESILWSLAKQARVPHLRYPAEDDVYEKPILDKLGL